MQSAKEINLAFQGGGAKGFEYVGCSQALKEHNFVVKNIAGSSAGALQALLVALGVDAEELRKVMIASQESEMGHIDDIQDFIPAKKRQECFDIHYGLLENFIQTGVAKSANWFESIFFNHLLWPHIEAVLGGIGKSFSQDLFKLQGAVQQKLVPEMLINGELVYGQKLVQMIQGFLDKYLKPYIDKPQDRKNITMAQFKATVGVNLIFTGTDLTDKMLRIFTALTAPKLPVKFACRMSAGFPFFFPPLYWQDSWGKYLGEDITGNKIVDGGMLLNLPTALITSSDYFREKYIGADPIDPESVIAFSFVKEHEQEKKGPTQYTKQDVASLPDRWPPTFDTDYLKAVGRGHDFKHPHHSEKIKPTQFDKLNIPGITLLQDIIATFMKSQEAITREIFKENTVILDVTGIDTLNFSLTGVNVEEEIKKAKERTEEILAKKFK